MADDHLKRAIDADPTFVPAYSQLADLYRAGRDEARAEAMLRPYDGDAPEAGAAWAMHAASG